MKKSFIACCALLFSTVVGATPAPDIQLNAADLPAKLSELKGKVVYLDFWASWCGPCRKSFPWMNQLQSKFSPQDFVVIAVNVDKEGPLAEQFLQQVPAQFPVVYDPEGVIASNYQLKGMPSSFVIDRSGEIVFAHTGFYAQKTAQYEAEIAQLIAPASAVDKAPTKAK